MRQMHGRKVFEIRQEFRVFPQALIETACENPENKVSKIDLAHEFDYAIGDRRIKRLSRC